MNSNDQYTMNSNNQYTMNSNAAIVSITINSNGNSQSNELQNNHSQWSQQPPQSCVSNNTQHLSENSLIHQQLQQQLMHETLIYERMRASFLLQQKQEADVKQREAYVGCDGNGFVHFVSGSVLRSTNHIKYSMISELGHGTYSRVFECRRIDEHRTYAIKLVRNIEKYQSAAMREIDILKRIKANDANDTSCCIHIVDAGFYFGHPMFVFPLLSNSLRSSITPHNPFSHSQITNLMWQMCRAVAFIHSLGIINTDLKPDNIMFVSDESEWTDLKIKIIDFGAAVMCDKERKHHHMIQTREYRATEVILAKKW
eukprot:891992_1